MWWGRGRGKNKAFNAEKSEEERNEKKRERGEG
jgi:hypothetical protein